MPWSFERRVIYPAGWSLGPSSYGQQMALTERVWQAYQTIDGLIHLRRAKADLSDWEWEEQIVIPDHPCPSYPDVCFDKAGEPFVAFESDSGVWIRRISIVDGLRTAIVEKLIDGAYGPKCFRDPDNDLLVFYVEKMTSEIRYRVQSEGWAEERKVEGVEVGQKRIQNVELGRHWRNNAVKIVIAYSLGDQLERDNLRWAVSSPYPPGDGDLVLIGAETTEIVLIPAFWRELNEASRLNIGADISFFELVNNNIELVTDNLLQVSVDVSNMVVVSSVYKTLDEKNILNIGADVAAMVIIPAHCIILNEPSQLSVEATISGFTLEIV